MTTKKYTTPPVRPNAHLEQLTGLKAAKADDLSEFQRLIRHSLLSERALKALRKMHIQEMAVTGYNLEQISLAFVAVDSPLNALVDGLQSKSGAIMFRGEINEALKECAGLSAADHRAIHIRSRQRLLEACWGLLGSVDAQHGRALIELMDKLQLDVAEANGAIGPKVGRRSGMTGRGRGQGAAADVASSAPAAEPVGQPSADVDWREEFAPDDSPEDANPST